MNTATAPMFELHRVSKAYDGVRLLRVEPPLALRPILAGINIAAVINVGTATLGALIGAGGRFSPASAWTTSA